MTRLGICITVRVVPELGQHPGAERHPQSWQGTDDLGVRVLLKTVGQFGLDQRPALPQLEFTPLEPMLRMIGVDLEPTEDRIGERRYVDLMLTGQ